MKVTIIGAGNMGKAIGTRAAAGGHSVTLISKTREKAEKTAAGIRSATKNGAQVSTANLEDAELGDVVVLALWYGTNIEVARQLGSKLAGKIVVDIANPVNDAYDGLVTPPGSSSAEEVAKAVTPAAKVVKAFNTTYAGTLLARQVDGRPLDVFIAGDDADAKNKVAELVEDGGLRPVDTGPLSRARQIEGMQLLHIAVQGPLGTNWGSTLKVLG